MEEDPGCKFNRGHGSLALFLVPQAERDGASDGRVGQHRFFQFAHVDGVAARLDHIFGAADKPEKAKAIPRGQIPGTQPAVSG